MNNLDEFIILGDFEIKSGTLRITDPCYSRDTWCAGTVNVSPGTWVGAIEKVDEGSWGKRVGKLFAYKLNEGSLELAKTADDRLPIEVGVDSGQAGFFDDLIYPKSDTERGEYGQTNTFYGKACETTLSKSGPGAGIVKGGVVSSSGFGDGSYECYSYSVDKKIVALKLVFIQEE